MVMFNYIATAHFLCAAVIEGERANPRCKGAKAGGRRTHQAAELNNIGYFLVEDGTLLKTFFQYRLHRYGHFGV